MKKILNYFVILLMTFSICSCGNADEPKVNTGSQDRDFEVVTIPGITPISRTDSEDEISSDVVLKFKDQDAYDRTLSSIKAMDEVSKQNFFREIGFDGAYMLINKADEELDEAFDLAETVDSISGVKIIRDCVGKYTGILKFNEDDISDVTPLLPFADEDAELLGNKKGYIMIGNEIIAPKSAPGPAYNGSFIKYKAEVTVKNGHYKSYFRLGRIGQNMAIQLETYRRILGFKKSDNKCCYDGHLEIWSNGKQEVAVIHNGKGNWKLYSLASIYSPRINMKLTNFSSTRNSNNKVSKTIENILVQ